MRILLFLGWSILMLINNIHNQNRCVSIANVISAFIFWVSVPWRYIRKLCACTSVAETRLCLLCVFWAGMLRTAVGNQHSVWPGDTTDGLRVWTFALTALSLLWPVKELSGWQSSSLQPCRTPAALFTDPSRFLRALYTKALFLPTQTAALPTASPAPGMDFPAIQTALCLRLDLPIPWTPPLAMAFHLRSVPCFQTDDLLYTRTKQPVPWGSHIMNCQI